MQFVIVAALSAVLASTPEVPTGPAATALNHVVFLKSGRTVPSISKPIIAFGKVRYQSADRRVHELPARAVDLEKTRAHAARQGAGEPQGTYNVFGTRGARQATGAEPTPRKQTARVYSATWCGYCTKLKAWLRSSGIPHSITEVDRLPAPQRAMAVAEMRRAAGRAAYPTTIVGQAVIVGYNPEAIAAAVQR